MATPANVIQVPRPAPGSFNQDRPAGKLLISQTQHIREALIKHLEEVARVLAVDIRSLRTEGEVSDYVRQATAILHPHGVKHEVK
jgi:hypothetical protein